MARDHKRGAPAARKPDGYAQTDATTVTAALAGHDAANLDRSLWLRTDPDLTDDLVAGMHFSSNEIAVIPRHEHSKGQLMHVLRGVIVVGTPHASYTLPPGRAIWLPPGVPHSARYPQTSEMSTVFVEACAFGFDLPGAVRVYRLDDLTRALLMEAASFDCGSRPTRMESIALELLFDRLSVLDDRGLTLPEGRDPRLRRATAWFMANPAAGDDLDHLAGIAYCSRRTLYRLFECETGMTPGLWRRQMRMALALERLAHGEPVAQVAADLGFSAPGNFTAAFKAAFGTTPSSFFR